MRDMLALCHVVDVILEGLLRHEVRRELEVMVIVLVDYEERTVAWNAQ